MAEQKTIEIMLPENTTLLVKGGKFLLRFEFNDQGGAIHSNAPVSVYLPSGKDEPLVRIPRIGEIVDEYGWKYGGISPSTEGMLFVSPRDEPVRKTWNKAVNYTASLKKYRGYVGSQQNTEDLLLEALEKGTHDHGVRMPTEMELSDNLYENRVAIGGFNTTLAHPSYSSWYLTCTDLGGNDVSVQRFNYGDRSVGSKNSLSSIRLVRS